MKFHKTMLRAFLYILAAIAIHLIIIYFLGIRIEGGGGAEITFLLTTYFLPLALGFTNAFLFSRTKRIVDQLTWFLFTVIPSSLLLFLFVELQRAGGSEDEGIISWTMPKYSGEMIYLLPLGMMIVQTIMSLYYFINVRVWKRY